MSGSGGEDTTQNFGSEDCFFFPNLPMVRGEFEQILEILFVTQLVRPEGFMQCKNEAHEMANGIAGRFKPILSRYQLSDPIS